MPSRTPAERLTSNGVAYEHRKVFARPYAIVDGKRYPQGYRYYLDPPTPNPAPDDQFFLLTAVEFWLTRYIPRMHALDPERVGRAPLTDSVARGLLLARTQDRNRAFSTLPQVSAQQLQFADTLISTGKLDIRSLMGIPSYGPSFVALWSHAKGRGLSDSETLAYIWKWAKAWPPAWERDDDRKSKGLPLVDPQVERRLQQVVAWRDTGDMTFPWEAHPDEQHWRVRLNDFPDDHVYTLLVDGIDLGDFDNWPEAWERTGTERPPATTPAAILTPRANIDPGTLVSRYDNGEHEAVWRDLVSLGPSVREAPYIEPAKGVARETMRRARHNVELLLCRLRELDYHFYGEEPYRPATPEEEEALAGAAAAGLAIPLSIAAWLTEVGWVDFVGSHPTLCFAEDDEAEPPAYADPMELTTWNLIDLTTSWKRNSSERRKPIRIELGADPKSKARFVAGWEASGSYSMLLPNAAADGVVDGAPNCLTFVEYLRLSFRWGGFPGWANYDARPEKDLNFLREKLLPI